jgi:hypothetical protein
MTTGRRHLLVRRLTAAAVVAVAVALVGGCNSSALTKREVVVYFTPNAPISDHAAALKACAHATPAAIPEPIVKSNLVSDSVGDVRFRVDHADDRQLAILTECLNRQPGVEGWDVPDLTD